MTKTRFTGIVCAAFMFAATALSAQTGGGIRWFYSLESAQRRAQATGTNIVALITAPSWCNPCEWMEENTLQDETIVAALNEQFTALLMLDTNPQHRNFDFPGYPTVVVTDPFGEVLEMVVGAKTAEELETELAAYTRYRPDGEYDTPPVRYVSDDGYFQRIRGDRWQETMAGSARTYSQYDADSDYYYLKSDVDDSYVAVPREDGLSWYWSEETEQWQALRPVRRVVAPRG